MIFLGIQHLIRVLWVERKQDWENLVGPEVQLRLRVLSPYIEKMLVDEEVLQSCVVFAH